MIETRTRAYSDDLTAPWVAAWPWGGPQSSLVQGGGQELYKGRRQMKGKLADATKNESGELQELCTLCTYNAQSCTSA